MSTDAILDDDDGGQPAATPKTGDDFLLAEYTSITQAYFNTTTTIAAFFKNYLAIVGLPIPILGFLWTQQSKGDASPSVPDDLAFLVPTVACLIFVLGLSVMVYVVNLRLDALLYARTVNGIRKHFLNQSPQNFPDELRSRVLPRSALQPRYFEWHYFFSVIVVFAVLDSLYPMLGWAWMMHKAHIDSSALPSSLAAVGVVGVLQHFVAYWILARYRETRYLRTYKIGLDIDGVLNKHREQFAETLSLLRNKIINPEAITWIPVRDCQGLGVTLQDEKAVLNHTFYWLTMPVMDGAAEAIKKLKRTLGYRIYVFTHRPWPEPETYPSGEEDRYRRLWSMQSSRSVFGAGTIRAMTKDWLRRNGILYNRLFIERGNVHAADRRIKVRNRFSISERKEIRIFVEDDYFKARKLADICEIVFLIDQPYNQAQPLVKNMIRVQSWNDIYEYIRQEL